MPYIGNQGSVAGFVNQPSKQDLTGATGGTLTLTHAVSGPEDISLFINNVRQEPTESYTATGTTVTLQGYTVAATDDIYVLYNGLTQLSSVPADGSVSMAKLASTGTLPALDGSALTNLNTFSPSYALLEDRKTLNSQGGTTVSPSAFAHRALNTEVSDPDNIVTLSGNAFTLGSGTYRIDWACPAYNVGDHKSRLHDTTNTTYYDGESAWADNSGAGGQSWSRGSAIVTLTANATFRIEHRCAGTGVASGYGGATNFGQHEIYTRVQIVKIAD